MKPTLNMTDLAERAGVSVASVSRALNDAPGVSEKLRARIKALADDLSYSISPDAARLAKGSNGRIAFVTPDVASWFFASMLDGVISALHGSNLDVLLYEVKEEPQRQRFFEELPARRQVDAVILIAMPISDDERRRLELMQVPVVMAGGVLGDHPHVHIDDVAAGYQAGSHLLSLGHERVGMINASGHWTLKYAGPDERRRGFEQAYREAGLHVPPELVVQPRWGAEGGAAGIEQLLSTEDPPSAILAFSDEIAFGAIATLRRRGLHVPQDISIIGIDDHAMSDAFDLTTISQPVVEQGHRAGQLAQEILETGVAKSPHIILPTELILRDSTRPK